MAYNIDDFIQTNLNDILFGLEPDLLGLNDKLNYILFNTDEPSIFDILDEKTEDLTQLDTIDNQCIEKIENDKVQFVIIVEEQSSMKRSKKATANTPAQLPISTPRPNVDPILKCVFTQSHNDDVWNCISSYIERGLRHVNLRQYEYAELILLYALDNTITAACDDRLTDDFVLNEIFSYYDEDRDLGLINWNYFKKHYRKPQLYFLRANDWKKSAYRKPQNSRTYFLNQDLIVPETIKAALTRFSTRVPITL